VYFEGFEFDWIGECNDHHRAEGLGSTDWEGILWYSIRMPGYGIDMDLFSYCIPYL